MRDATEIEDSEKALDLVKTLIETSFAQAERLACEPGAAEYSIVRMVVDIMFQHAQTERIAAEICQSHRACVGPRHSIRIGVASGMALGFVAVASCVEYCRINDTRPNSMFDALTKWAEVAEEKNAGQQEETKKASQPEAGSQ